MNLPAQPIYGAMVMRGVIEEKESTGNDVGYVKGGLIYDTRDVEANPFKGVWSEAVISVAPSFLGDGAYSYSKLTLIHRKCRQFQATHGTHF